MKSKCLKFSVLTKTPALTIDGESYLKPAFHNIVLFGEEAKKYEKLLKKDAWVYIEGEMSQDKSKTNKRYYNNIKNPKKLEIITKKKQSKPATKTRKAA